MVDYSPLYILQILFSKSASYLLILFMFECPNRRMHFTVECFTVFFLQGMHGKLSGETQVPQVSVIHSTSYRDSSPFLIKALT